MPDKKPTLKDSSWINFMRVHKHYFPAFDTISRRLYYPFASKLYNKWKEYYKDLPGIKNKQKEIQTMYSFISFLPR